MVEFLSEDVLEWARDLAAVNKLFAGEPTDSPRPSATILSFRAQNTNHQLSAAA